MPTVIPLFVHCSLNILIKNNRKSEHSSTSHQSPAPWLVAVNTRHPERGEQGHPQQQKQSGEVLHERTPLGFPRARATAGPGKADADPTKMRARSEGWASPSCPRPKNLYRLPKEQVFLLLSQEPYIPPGPYLSLDKNQASPGLSFPNWECQGPSSALLFHNRTTPALGFGSSIPLCTEAAPLRHALVPDACANRRVTRRARRVHLREARHRMLLLSSCAFSSLFCSNLAFPVPSLFNKSQMQTASLNRRNSSSLLRK